LILLQQYCSENAENIHGKILEAASSYIIPLTTQKNSTPAPRCRHFVRRQLNFKMRRLLRYDH